MSNEMYHYGIPGMRWGHRKLSNLNKNTQYNKKEKYKKIGKMATAIAIGSLATVGGVSLIKKTSIGKKTCEKLLDITAKGAFYMATRKSNI